MEKVMVVLMLITFGTTSAADGPLVIPCNSDDLPCVNNSTHLFLQKTQHGLPLLKIRPIDPLVIKSAEYYGLIGAAYKFSDVTVSGLKDVIVSDFKMDMNAKTVVLTTKGVMTVTGKLEIVIPGNLPSGSEPFTSQVLSTVTIKYNYELKKNDKGDEHFDVGPWQFKCKVVGPLKLNVGQSKDKQLPESVLCYLLKEAYQVVVQNLREATKHIPASEFITNIH